MTACMPPEPIAPDARRRLAGTPLSARDVQVLDRVARGWTNREIAEDLGLSPLTVKSHVARIQTKLQARNRAHAVALAHRTGQWMAASLTRGPA